MRAIGDAFALWVLLTVFSWTVIMALTGAAIAQLAGRDAARGAALGVLVPFLGLYLATRGVTPPRPPALPAAGPRESSSHPGGDFTL